MENHHAALIGIQFRIAGRNLTRTIRNFKWAMLGKTLNDEETFAMRLAERHAKEGRFDLVEEDLAWLGRRLAGA